MRDTVVARAGNEWAEIAALFLSIGDEDAAALTYLEGARWSHACADVLGAIVFVKQALKLHPRNEEALVLSRTLWAQASLGDTRDPVG